MGSELTKILIAKDRPARAGTRRVGFDSAKGQG
jgi:hypothetical protein